MWDFKFKSFLHDISSHAEKKAAVPRKGCDMPGCGGLGDYRAPKSRYDLQDHYWFCLDHVREYNANWDYFKGMSRVEIENHMHSTALWDRPTWRSTKAGLNEDRAREKIHAHFTTDGMFGDFSMNGGREEKPHFEVSDLPHPTVEALAVLDLAPPVQWEEVKARYKTLAKKHHPDANAGCREAEEKFKKITLAYNIIRLSYKNYTKLED